MFKLVLGKAEEQRSNGQHPLDHAKSKRVPENIYFCFIDYAKTFDCVDHNKLWKILTQMGIPDHLTCLLRNLYAGQGATVRMVHGTNSYTDGNTRPPYLPLEKSVCRSRSNS